SEGSKIGNYNDTKPIYVNPDKSPKKFKNQGKESKSDKFNNGNLRLTRYFESYKQYRSTIGRPVDKVNLTLTGSLRNDFGKAVTKISNIKYTATARDENEKIMEGQEDRFGKIFDLTKKERA